MPAWWKMRDNHWPVIALGLVVIQESVVFVVEQGSTAIPRGAAAM